MTMPVLGEGPDDSIDLFWSTPTFELLVNYPRADGLSATFYADDLGKTQIKGTFMNSGSLSNLLMNIIGVLNDHKTAVELAKVEANEAKP